MGPTSSAATSERLLVVNFMMAKEGERKTKYRVKFSDQRRVKVEV